MSNCIYALAANFLFKCAGNENKLFLYPARQWGTTQNRQCVCTKREIRTVRRIRWSSSSSVEESRTLTTNTTTMLHIGELSKKQHTYTAGEWGGRDKETNWFWKHFWNEFEMKFLLFLFLFSLYYFIHFSTYTLCTLTIQEYVNLQKVINGVVHSLSTYIDVHEQYTCVVFPASLYLVVTYINK